MMAQAPVLYLAWKDMLGQEGLKIIRVIREVYHIKNYDIIITLIAIDIV